MSTVSNLLSRMAFLSSDLDVQRIQLLAVAASIIVLITCVLAITVFRSGACKSTFESVTNFTKFFYVSFLKPHTGDGLSGQQGALESFYKAQVWEGRYLQQTSADGPIEGRYL